MSNLLTRKGLAFASGLAVLLSGLVGIAPAQATSTIGVLPLTVANNNYVSIGQSGIYMATSFTAVNDTGNDTDDGATIVEDTDEWLRYEVVSTDSALPSSAIFDAIQAGKLAAKQAYLGTGVATGTTSITVPSTVNFNSITFENGKVILNVNDFNVSPGTVYTNVIQLYVPADAYAAGDVKPTWSFTVKPYTNDAAASAVPVKLYGLDDISASVSITEAEVAATLKTEVSFNKSDLNPNFVLAGPGGAPKVAMFNKPVTLTETIARTGASSPVLVTASNANDNRPISFSSSKYTSVSNGTLAALPAGATSATYQAAVWYNDGATDSANTFVAGSTSAFAKWLSGASNVASITAGTSADAAGIEGFVTDTKDLIGGTNSATARAGVNTHSVSAQILTATPADLAVANVRVRAVVTATTLANVSARVSVKGGTKDLNDGESETLYLRTNDKGQVTWDITNSFSANNDIVTITFSVEKRDGTWVAGTSYVVTWADTALAGFDASTDAISGDSITISYDVYDQFGEALSSLGSGSTNGLSVTLVGTNNGTTINKTLLNLTQPVVNGAASFTFTNYATVDNFVWVAGILHRNSVTNAAITALTSGEGGNYELTKVYKNAATDAVTNLQNSYQNKVVYMDFKNGTYSARVVDKEFRTWAIKQGPFADFSASAATLAGRDAPNALYTTRNSEYQADSVVMFGTVVTSTGKGAAYQDVTISGVGHYFEVQSSAGPVFSTNTATARTDENGTFTVRVWSHMENLSGSSVSVTSGGKSFATKIVTVMNTDISAEQYWNGSAWVDAAVITTNWKRTTGGSPALNTIYNLKATARDIWGNVLRGNGATTGALVTLTNGYMTVSLVNRTLSNSTTGQISGRTDANGQLEFKVRSYTGNSVSAGPFAFAAEVDGYAYSTGSTLLAGSNFDITSASAFNTGLYKVTDEGFLGKQASARAGVKKGVVVATVNNAKGKTVRVYVAGKLRKTVVADKTNFVTRVKGIKAGDKRVTVKVGKQRLFSGFISVM